MTASPLYCSTCGAANASDDDICFACHDPLGQPGSEHEDEFLLQGRYQVLTQVGTGGFGAVYKARDTLQGHQMVAVKQINLRGLTSQETIEATDGFNREVQMLSALFHEHLPRIHDHFTDAEHWYLVMDFISGETLERYLIDEAVSQQAIRMLSFDEILNIGLQLCDVLTYLHTRQPVIIFRDLKPSNIMRSPDGKLYLIDFGIARRFTPGKSKDTIPLGSPGYAAPEQYGKAQTTPRADIYSLGALLHHLLSGNDPADTPFSFSSLRLYGSTGLAELEALITRMVAMDANKRPSDVVEVTKELQRITELRSRTGLQPWQSLANTQSVHPAPSVQSAPSARSVHPAHYWQLTPLGAQGSQGQQQQHMLKALPSSRRKLIINGLAIGAGLLLGGGPALSILQTQQHKGWHSFYAGEIEKDVYKYSSAINAMSWSPNGDYLALATSNSTIHVWNTRNWMVHFFSSTDIITSLSWSSDSTMLAGTAGRTLQIWGIKQHRVLYQQEHMASGESNTVVWAPQGTHMALAGSDGSLNILDAGNPQDVKLLTRYKNIPAGKKKVLLAWSSDGNFIAVNAYKMIQVRVASSGQIAGLLGSPEDDPITLSWSPHGLRVAMANGDGNVQVWDQRTGRLFTAYNTADDNNSFVTNLAWSSEGRYLGAATMSGKVYFWDTQQRQSQPFVNYNALEPGAASLIAWSPREPRIAVCYDDGRCLVWKAPSTS